MMKKISELGVVPVIKLEKAEWALPLGKALIKGGLPIAEVTFRTSCAPEAIAIIRDNYPEIILGAGTVTKTEQVDLAIESGAKFIVSPGFNPRIVKYCNDKGIMIIPGVTNPSQAEQAMDLGLKTLKFFPAEAAGGIPMLKSMGAVYPDVQFMPTGGISPKNLNDYLALPIVPACGGTWMVKAELFEQGNYDEISRLCKEAVELAAKGRK